MVGPAGIPLAVIGCDFRAAPSRARSRLVLDEHEALVVADELERGGWAEGVAFLDTCNRNEWIVASDQPAWAAQLLLGRMRQRLEPGVREQVAPYVHVGDQAARHLFRVAIGQESLVVGERQISGQLFKALDRSRVRGTSSRVLNGLGSIAGRLVRIALRRGCLEGAAVGVHSLAVNWIREQLPPGRGARLAVVGLGSIGRRVAAVLDEDPRLVGVRCNRTAPPGSGLVPLTELDALLAEVDGAIVCTSAPRPILDPARLPPRPPDRPLFLVDIGIPQQIAEGTPPAGVRRAGLDRLVEWHRARCPEPAGAGSQQAEDLVERALGELRRYCNEPAFAPVLERVRGRSRRAGEELGALLNGQGLKEAQRARLEADLRTLLATYADDVLQAIRDGSRNLTEATPWNDAS